MSAPAACCLDLPVSTSNQQHPYTANRRRPVAKRLARKRLLESSSQQQQQNQAPPANNNNTNNDEAFYRRPDMSSYRTCCFLNHDTVLAADSQACVDIVKLPRYRSSSSTCSSNEGARMGTLLASQLSVATARDSDEHARQECQLRSLQSGASFFVGLPGKEYRVFDTEYATCTSSSLRPLFTSKKAASVSQGCLPNGRDSHWTRAWSVLGPSRRYSRFARNSLLQQLALGPVATAAAESGAYPWSADYDCERMTGSIFHDSAALWDIWETPSALFTVSGDFDCFCLSDSRVAHSETVPRHDVIVDKDCSAGGRIAAVCFASQYVVATALDRLGASDFGQYATCIKLWDLRMLSATEHCTLPSFPRERGHVLDPMDTLSLQGSHSIPPRGKHGGSESESVFTQGKTKSLSRGTNGTLLATLQQDPEQPRVSHCLLDPATGSLLKRIAHLGGGGDESPAFAVDQSHELLACLRDCPVRDSMLLHDLQSPPAPCNRKRSYSDSDTREWDAENSFAIQTLDGYGIKTSLSSLAFDESGTSLVGSSLDGDLFVWRV